MPGPTGQHTLILQQERATKKVTGAQVPAQNAMPTPLRVFSGGCGPRGAEALCPAYSHLAALFMSRGQARLRPVPEHEW